MTELEKARQRIDEIDREMAELFAARMKAVKKIAEYKKETGMPVLDAAREAEILQKNSALPSVASLSEYYIPMFQEVLSASRAYQRELLGEGKCMVFARGLLSSLKAYLPQKAKLLIVTDNGVPQTYIQTVLSQFPHAILLVFPQGEEYKNVASLQKIWQALMEAHFDRGDAIVTLGGGMIGDLGGFAAATYRRGIACYQIPTTLLAMVDASVGGKTAINFGGIKNSVGAFAQPVKTLIDIELLSTLPARQISSGFAEALKIALTSDVELFSIFEKGEEKTRIEEVIRRAVAIKQKIVLLDEKEGGLRRVLNFGHTFGHGIESTQKELYHGECVALGMLPMCAPKVQKRVLPILGRLGLPTAFSGDVTAALNAARHDKKCDGDEIYTVYCPDVGQFEIKKIPIKEWETNIRCYLQKEGK